MDFYKLIFLSAETDRKEIITVPADKPNCHTRYTAVPNEHRRLIPISIGNVRKLSKASASQKDQKNRFFQGTHPDLTQYREKPRGMTAGYAKKTTETICILTVSFYASMILLFISLMFKLGAADDVITRQLFYPELPRQVMIILLAGLPFTIISLRWLKLHP
jgi:hypothetical protein